MLHIYSRQIIGVFALLLCLSATMSVSGQRVLNRSANPNFNKFQQKPFYYGITLGYNSSFFNVNRSKDFLNNNQFDVVESIDGPGFNIGVIGNLKIGQYFDLRSLINFSFSSRTMTYRLANSDLLEMESLSSTFVEVPFLLRFKSAPYKDKRVFVITGFKYAYDASNKSNVATDDFQLNLSPHDFQYEIGAGVQFFLPFFILSPEIKFSQGLGNIFIYNQDDTRSRIIDRILSRSITFSLNFEG